MKKLILTSLCVLFIAGTALADWNPGDPYKMDHPQLPDPTGWDINFNWYGRTFADDFKCTSTGPITDIHFWVSWQGDVVGSITGITAGIYESLAYPLWNSSFSPGQFTMKYAGSGLQGWDDPYPDSTCLPNDHINYYQVNIEDIADPYTQEAGKTYWLGLTVWMKDGQMGWKTTLDSDRWGSPAKYPSLSGSWQPIAVCTDNHPVDLAFVITPEPATICLLGLGALSLLNRKKNE